MGTALTPSLENHCITSQEHGKKASKKRLKYLTFYAINCIKRAAITQYSDWMTKKCRIDSWYRQRDISCVKIGKIGTVVHPLPCNTEVESAWSSTSTPLCLHGMLLIFTYGQLYFLTSNTENQRSLTKIILVTSVFCTR